jgi:broad specificity phosphatase PhoE
MSEATTLLLLRHAEVEVRYQRIFGGAIDMDLSPRGHEQAAMLAKYVAGKPFDALYASPMKRVQQTIAPLLERKSIQPTILPGLREVNFGDWTGLGYAQVKEKFGVSAFDWLNQLEQDTIPNAEGDVVFRARVEPCLRQILAAHPGQTVAVACHGGTIRMILSILTGLPLSRMALFDIDYASLSEVAHLGGKTEIRLLNFTSWRHAV